MRSVLKYLFLSLIAIIVINSANAQYLSQKGFFQADFIKGCEGLTVTIDTVLNSGAPITCFYQNACNVDWGDGTTSSSATAPPRPTHTYIESGIYEILVFFSNEAGFDTLQIEVNESIPPDYNVYACTGRRVFVDITDTDYDRYLIDDGLGSVADTVDQGGGGIIIDYSGNPGAQTISVAGLENGGPPNCPTNSETLTPLTALPPGTINSIEVISDSEIVLDYSLANNVLYQLQISPNGGNSYSPVKNITPDFVTDTVRNLNTTDNYYCFRIATVNSCDNTIDNLSSPVICSINLSLETLDGSNRLTWETSPPGQNFDILRDDLASPLASASANADTYLDFEIVCETEYCYTIVGNYPGGITSTSLPVCGTTFSTVPPDSIRNISTRVTGNGINLSWVAPASNLTYDVFKKQGSDASLLGSSDTTFINLTNLDPGTQHCFEINSRDECGNETFGSILGCTILLTGSIDKEDNITLNWTAYQGWENGVSRYIVQKNYPQGGGQNINVTEATFSETDNSNNQVIEYTIIAVPNDNLNSSISNTVRIVKQNNIYFPSAFTPDGDGLNDVFQINGRFIVDFELSIFNRWGELVYYSKDLDSGWSGELNNTELPEGTYIFRAEVKDLSGRQIERDGAIMLLRK